MAQALREAGGIGAHLLGRRDDLLAHVAHALGDDGDDRGHGLGDRRGRAVRERAEQDEAAAARLPLLLDVGHRLEEDGQDDAHRVRGDNVDERARGLVCSGGA